MEKREFPRIQVNIPIEIDIEDRKIHSKVKNVSVGGILLCVEKESYNDVSEIDINKEILFTVEGEEEAISQKGRILRFYKEDGQTYIGISFL